jgi:hypothetical protein
MGKGKSKILTSAICTALSASILLIPPAAYAGNSWHIGASSATQYTGQNVNSDTLSAAALRNNIAYVDNNNGTILAKISPQLMGDSVVSNLTIGAPTVMAVYNKETNLGQIFVDNAEKLQMSKSTLLVQKIVTPLDGADFKNSFLGQNPFQAMYSPSYPNFFYETTLSSFLTAVGLVMQHTHAAIGWIATDDTTTKTHTTTTTSWGIIGTTTWFEVANTTPVWSEALPMNSTGVDINTGYTIPIPGTSGASQVRAMINSSSGSSATTIGYPVSVTYNGNQTGGLEINSGVNLVSCTTGCSLPVTQYNSAYLSASERGLNMIGAIFIGVMIGGLPGAIMGAVALNNLGVTPPNLSALSANGMQSTSVNALANMYGNANGLAPVTDSQVSSSYTPNNSSNILAYNMLTLANQINSASVANVTGNQAQTPYNQNPFTPFGSTRIQRALDPWPNVTASMFNQNQNGYNPNGGVHLNPFSGDNNSFGQGFNNVTPSNADNINASSSNQPFMEQPETYSLGSAK